MLVFGPHQALGGPVDGEVSRSAYCAANTENARASWAA